VSLTPNSGSGTSATFQAVYTDPNGVADLDEILLQVNSSQNSANACYVYYKPQGNLLYLSNNAGTVWMTPALTPGVAGTASNSQCTLNAGSSSVATAGNDLTLTVALNFTFAGTKNVYLYAAGMSGENSGWVKEGTWVVTSAGPPTVVSLTPSAATAEDVTFSAVYSDPNGAGDLNELLLQVNTDQSSTRACYVYYQPQGNNLYLYNNGAWMTPPLTPGVSGTASNNECKLVAGSSSVAISGNTLTLNVALAANINGPWLDGLANVYLYAAGLSGSNSGWVNKGTWTPTSAGATAVSLSPTFGAGTSVTFQGVISDPNGLADLSSVDLGVGSSGPYCDVQYQPQGNYLNLYNDAGTGFVTPTLTPGVPGTASNSQCTVNAGSSSVSTSGNELTLNVALSFSSTFVGWQDVFFDANTFHQGGGASSPEGMWNPSAFVPTVSVSPNSGAGTSVTLAAIVSDPNGAADVNEVLLQINTKQSSANACYVYYQPSANLLYLANNAGSFSTPGLTPGVAGIVSNSQCTLDAGSSSISSAGNNLTVNVALSFSATFGGTPADNFVSTENVYVYATGLSSGQNSTWVRAGTWVPNPSIGAPGIVSVSPDAGTGTSVTFQAVYSLGAFGASGLSYADLVVGSSTAAINGCSVQYQPQQNLLSLANDNDTAELTPQLTPGVPGTVSNSQCTLDAGSSSVSISGNYLTLNLALSFSGTFVGTQNIYLNAASRDGSTGWVMEGTWTP
jgi:hypothetical protein